MSAALNYIGQMQVGTNERQYVTLFHICTVYITVPI